MALIYYYYRKGKANIKALTMLNQEVGEQKGKLEFAMEELGKSNMDKDRMMPPVHPGAILREDILKEMKLTVTKAA